MTHGLLYEPLDMSHADELAAQLLSDRVYAYIDSEPPTPEQYRNRIRSILLGPPPKRPGIQFKNYVVSLEVDRKIIGILESTVHDGIAEVAYLFGPTHWGNGYATAGLLWLSKELLRIQGITSLLATTHPGNERSVRLLARCGYKPVEPSRAPELLSYEVGDLVFVFPIAA